MPGKLRRAVCSPSPLPGGTWKGVGVWLVWNERSHPAKLCGRYSESRPQSACRPGWYWSLCAGSALSRMVPTTYLWLFQSLSGTSRPAVPEGHPARGCCAGWGRTCLHHCKKAAQPCCCPSGLGTALVLSPGSRPWRSELELLLRTAFRCTTPLPPSPPWCLPSRVNVSLSPHSA